MRSRLGPTAYRTCDARWPSGGAATRPRSGAGCTSARRDWTPWSAPRPNSSKTWTLVAAELDDPPPASYDERVYGATAAQSLALVHNLPDEIGTTLLIGHSPDLRSSRRC